LKCNQPGFYCSNSKLSVSSTPIKRQSPGSADE
jgi:hypothetical protein